MSEETFQHGESSFAPPFREKLNALKAKSDETTVGDEITIHVDYIPGVGNVVKALPPDIGEDPGITPNPNCIPPDGNDQVAVVEVDVLGITPIQPVSQNPAVVNNGSGKVLRLIINTIGFDSCSRGMYPLSTVIHDLPLVKATVITEICDASGTLRKARQVIYVLAKDDPIPITDVDACSDTYENLLFCCPAGVAGDPSALWFLVDDLSPDPGDFVIYNQDGNTYQVANTPTAFASLPPGYVIIDEDNLTSTDACPDPCGDRYLELLFCCPDGGESNLWFLVDGLAPDPGEFVVYDGDTYQVADVYTVLEDLPDEAEIVNDAAFISADNCPSPVCLYNWHATYDCDTATWSYVNLPEDSGVQRPYGSICDSCSSKTINTWVVVGCGAELWTTKNVPCGEGNPCTEELSVDDVPNLPTSPPAVCCTAGPCVICDPDDPGVIPTLKIADFTDTGTPTGTNNGGGITDGYFGDLSSCSGTPDDRGVRNGWDGVFSGNNGYAGVGGDDTTPCGKSGTGVFDIGGIYNRPFVSYVSLATSNMPVWMQTLFPDASCGYILSIWNVANSFIGEWATDQDVMAGLGICKRNPTNCSDKDNIPIGPA